MEAELENKREELREMLLLTARGSGDGDNSSTAASRPADNAGNGSPLNLVASNGDSDDNNYSSNNGNHSEERPQQEEEEEGSRRRSRSVGSGSSKVQ